LLFDVEVMDMFGLAIATLEFLPPGALRQAVEDEIEFDILVGTHSIDVVEELLFIDVEAIRCSDRVCLGEEVH
jgi:hypothetical protein